MTDSFIAGPVLREIIAVLQKHGLPVNTIALDLSILPPEFERIFPHLKEYKAGVFYRTFELDQIPATIRVQRRMQFDDIVEWLEDNILPLATEIAEELPQTFPGLAVELLSRRVAPNPHWKQRRDYFVRVECRLDQLLGTRDNVIQLSIDLSQYDEANYPRITADVAWLVDEESGGDWGLDVISWLFPDNQQVHDGILQIVETGLPVLYNALEAAITERLQE
jgi:hypothetical protein